jgi:hypothetical protein
MTLEQNGSIQCHTYGLSCSTSINIVAGQVKVFGILAPFISTTNGSIQ